jgi:hypothetical protein
MVRSLRLGAEFFRGWRVVLDSGVGMEFLELIWAGLAGAAR